MRKLLIILALSMSTSVFAQSKADTIAVQQEEITKWIADTTITSKGKSVVKYYCIYKGALVSTNRTTVKNVALCRKHGAKAALVLITSKTGKRRIVGN